MAIDHRRVLKEIRTFPSLIRYLRDEVGWPITQNSFEDDEDLFFDFTPEELGLDKATAAKIESIRRLRPLSAKQPFGIFFIKFEPKRLPVVALRRILSSVVLKKRASAKSSERAAWKADDLLFISNFGEGDQRQISFAHFSQNEQKDDLPTLKVLGWDNRDTALHLDSVAKELTENLRWPVNEDDQTSWRNGWCSAFTLPRDYVITKSKDLSLHLAELAKAIRDRINTVLKIETEHGPVTKLMKAFQEALIHDLDADGFADMYAQTITYGLLSARITDPHKKTVDDFAGHMRTNPFLRELMETFLQVGGRRGRSGGPGIDFDELGVSEVVELLDDTNMEAVVRDFGDLNPQEDPVIHFYELFLKEYDAKKRMQRGVFYTPRPVVSYIVRSVHELLQTEFGLADGLADTATWGVMAQRFSGLTVPEGVEPTDRFVTVLDVATGTGTFLVVVIEVIYNTLVEKWKRQGHDEKKILDLWNGYVPQHLLPRLYGYELLMAPYAIAHLKVGLKLHETGYRFESDERARIYLTNSLEPAHDFSGRFEFAIPALAHEAQAVNEVKRKQLFTVVIGNPPYSINSANASYDINGELTFIGELLQQYKFVDGVPLGERNPKALQDDYVKFVRLSQWQIARACAGVMGLITNHGYLENPTFRGMRWHLVHTFDRLRICDLHGNAKKKEKAPDGGTDENVFDILQGVAIMLCSRTQKHGEQAIVQHTDVWGVRDDKYAWLRRHSVHRIKWTEVSPRLPLFLFVPQDTRLEEEYERGWKVTDVFAIYGHGIKTHRDDFAIAFDKQTIVKRICDLRDSAQDTATIRARYFGSIKSGAYPPGDNATWKLNDARRKVRKDDNWEHDVIPVFYRPFDVRFCYHSETVMDRPRTQIMCHMRRVGNVALITTRQTKPSDFKHVLVTRHVSEVIVLSPRTSTDGYVFPAYCFPDGTGDLLEGYETKKNLRQRRANLTPEFVRHLTQVLGLKLSEDGRGDFRNSVGSEGVLIYFYALLYSQSFRVRYIEFLKRDFPRLPLTENLELFRALARLGGELTGLHLLESPKLSHPVTEFVGGRNPEVEKVSWSKSTVWVDKAQTTGFKGVPEAVWNFHIGGYQVCEKWLKDRKGRTLSKVDIAHYQKIVVALNETIRLMKEIDEVIEKHGGWPGAFSTASSSEPLPNSNPAVADEIGSSVRDYGAAEESWPLAAETGSSFGASARPVTSENDGDGVSSPAPEEKKIEAAAGSDLRSIDDIEQPEIMAAIRQVFNDGLARDRETAIRDVARSLGFDRASSRIQERLDGELIAAVRRSIVVNEKGAISLRSRNIEDYSREYLKTLFLIDMGSVWWDRDDAINKATRYLGFTRTGSKIYDSFKSIINGLIREGRLDSDPEKGIRRK